MYLYNIICTLNLLLDKLKFLREFWVSEIFPIGVHNSIWLTSPNSAFSIIVASTKSSQVPIQINRRSIRHKVWQEFVVHGTDTSHVIIQIHLWIKVLDCYHLWENLLGRLRYQRQRNIPNSLVANSTYFGFLGRDKCVPRIPIC